MSIYNIENAVYVRDICSRHGIEIDLIKHAPTMISIMRKVGGKHKFAKWVEDNAENIKNALNN